MVGRLSGKFAAWARREAHEEVAYANWSTRTPWPGGSGGGGGGV